MLAHNIQYGAYTRPTPRCRPALPVPLPLPLAAAELPAEVALPPLVL